MNKNIALISRIFIKSFLAFVVIVFIFFYSVRIAYVSLPTRGNDFNPFLEDVTKKNSKKLDSLSINGIKNKKNNDTVKINDRKIENKTKNLILNLVKKTDYNKLLFSLVKAAFLNKHFAGDSYGKLEKLCKGFKTYCDILDIESSFSYQERLYYTALSIYILKYLNSIFPEITKKIYYIKIQEEKKGRRGYAGHHSIVMNIKKTMNYRQFFEVLTHELGHVIDLGIIEGDSFWKDANFTEFGKKNFSIDDVSIEFYKLSWIGEKVKNPNVSSRDFVSGYALTDIFEDFAETFNMYVNHNSVFRKMARESNILKKKYNFMKRILKGKYLKSDKYFDYSYGYRPRDSTKFSK